MKKYLLKNEEIITNGDRLGLFFFKLLFPTFHKELIWLNREYRKAQDAVREKQNKATKEILEDYEYFKEEIALLKMLRRLKGVGVDGKKAADKLKAMIKTPEQDRAKVENKKGGLNEMG